MDVGVGATRQDFSLMSVALVLVFAGIITGFNLMSNSPVGPEAVPEYEGYSNHSYSFSHLKGMSFYNGSLSAPTSDVDCGYLVGLTEEGCLWPQEIIVVWEAVEEKPGLNESLERAYSSELMGNVSFIRHSCTGENVTYHEALYENFTALDPEGGSVPGVVAVWWCNDTERSFTVFMLSQGGYTCYGEQEEAFLELLHSFRCHYRKWPRRGRLPDAVTDTISVSLMVLFCVGFTFTYKMEKFPNFAHLSYATVGSMVSFYLVRFLRFNPYDTWPFAALVGGLLGMVLYVGVVRPVGDSAGGWNRDIILTFTFYIIAHTMVSVIGMFNYWTRNAMGAPSTGFVLRWGDFRWGGLPGIALIGPIACGLLVVALHFFLTRTRLGTALRATAEDEDLAATLGIDVYRAHLASWFISGALSALAGSIITLWGGMGLGVTDDTFVMVMAGSALGGLDNVYGAIFGGIFISMAKKTLGNLLFMVFGLAIKPWERLLPIVFLVVILMGMPNGVTSIDLRSSKLVKYLQARFFGQIPVGDGVGVGD